MNDSTTYRGTREETLERGDIPRCRDCGKPSPLGDPCEVCAKIAQLLSMTDEEITAAASPEEIGWSRGMVEGIRLGTMIGCTKAVEEAAVVADRLLDQAAHTGSTKAAEQRISTIPKAIRALKVGYVRERGWAIAVPAPSPVGE